MVTNTNLAKLTKDLTKQAPRPPQELLGGVVILGRTIDKCRATIAKKNGEYHYDCPVDKGLFTFLGINGEQLMTIVKTGATDQEIADAVLKIATKRTPAEVKKFNDEQIGNNMSADAGKRAWFVGELKKMGLDEKKTTLFDWLNADDKASFAKKA